MIEKERLQEKIDRKETIILREWQGTSTLYEPLSLKDDLHWFKIEDDCLVKFYKDRPVMRFAFENLF